MELEAILTTVLSENVLLHITPKSNIEYLVHSQEDVWTRKDNYTIVGIGLSFFVLFFKVWWDDKEKKNQELEKDNIRLKYFSDQIESSIDFLLPMIDSYKAVISEINRKDYEVPERYIVYQFVVEDIINLKNLEEYNYLFSKYYKLHFRGKYNDILFTKIISTYKFYYRFDSRISESFEKARENQHQLKRKFMENIHLMNNLIHKMINNPSNEIIRKDLVELFLSQSNKEFNTYDSKFIVENYILKAMEIVSGSQTKDSINNFTPTEYKDVYDIYVSTLNVFERLKENVKNNFSEIEATIGSLEDALDNIKELSSELKFICQNMGNPIDGKFSYKLKKYLEIE